MYSVEKALLTALGPITGALTPTGTAPLTGQGILNLSNLSTTPVKVLSAGTAGKVRRCTLVVISPTNVAWGPTTVGGASTITALGTGASTEGAIVFGGGGVTVDFTVADNLDLYLVAGGAGTIINLTVVEQ